MKGHGQKAVPDRVLSGMIMKCMKIAEDKGKLLTGQLIHDYISTNTFYFESPDLDK